MCKFSNFLCHQCHQCHKRKRDEKFEHFGELWNWMLRRSILTFPKSMDFSWIPHFIGFYSCHINHNLGNTGHFSSWNKSHGRLHWYKWVLWSMNKLGNAARKFPSFLDFILLIWLGCSPNCWNSKKFPTLLDICHNIKQQYGELRRLQLERSK